MYFFLMLGVEIPDMQRQIIPGVPCCTALVDELLLVQSQAGLGPGSLGACTPAGPLDIQDPARPSASQQVSMNNHAKPLSFYVHWLSNGGTSVICKCTSGRHVQQIRPLLSASLP